MFPPVSESQGLRLSPAQISVTRERPARAIHAQAQDGKTYVLRPTLMSDVDAILRAFDASRAELCRFMPWAHQPQSTLQQLERLRECEANYFSGRELSMALFERNAEQETLVTMIGLHPRVPLNPSGLEIGYWTPTPFAGRGLASYASKLIVIYAFDKLGADRVQAICDEANVASRRVMEKVGMRQEGLLHNITQKPSEGLLQQGFIHTGRNPMFALTPSEFQVLPWVPELRPTLRYFNIVGEAVSAV
jgi:ribosomal-protein-serine acetyltransferase